jgi:hypothetical protein
VYHLTALAPLKNAFVLRNNYHYCLIKTGAPFRQGARAQQGAAMIQQRQHTKNVFALGLFNIILS